MSDTTSTKPCRHENLAWASGGFYLLCTACGAKWMAVKTNTDEPDYSRAKAALGEKE